MEHPLTKFIEKEISRDIDARSVKLSQEFYEHVQECQSKNPKMTDIHLIFQGWAIQKIAALQIWTTGLADRVDELDARKKKR
jgi:hypothetical protein